MVWTAGKSMCGDLAREIAVSEKDIPIREININTVSALYPQKRATSEGGWRTHKGASNFSALSLAFAYQLHKELDMPIGILLSAHSNTRIEAFTQRQSIEKQPGLKSDAKLIHDADPLTEQGRNSLVQYEEDIRAWQKLAGDAVVAGARAPRVHGGHEPPRAQALRHVRARHHYELLCLSRSFSRPSILSLASPATTTS